MNVNRTLMKTSGLQIHDRIIKTCGVCIYFSAPLTVDFQRLFSYQEINSISDADVNMNIEVN